MAFDIEGARKAGYTDDEIADFLGSEAKFDVARARAAGYSSAEIVSHLATLTPKDKPGKRPREPIYNADPGEDFAAWRETTPPEAPVNPSPALTAQQKNDLLRQKNLTTGDVFGALPVAVDAIKKNPAIARVGPTIAAAENPEGYRAVQAVANNPDLVAQGFDQAAEIAKASQPPKKQVTLEQRIQDQMRANPNLGRYDAETLARDAEARGRESVNPEVWRAFERGKDLPAQMLSAADSGIARAKSGVLDSIWMLAEQDPTPLDTPAVSTVKSMARGLLGTDEKGAVQRLELARQLDQRAEALAPKLLKTSFDDAWKNNEFASWALVQASAQSPQVAMMLATIVAPEIAPATLPAMGISAAGNQYAENREYGVEKTRAALDAMINGGVEVGSEAISLGLGKIASPAFKKLLASMPDATRKSLALSLLARGGAAAAVAGGAAVSEGTSEAAGQVLQDLSQKNIAGRDPGDMAANARNAFFAALLPGALFASPGIVSESVQGVQDDRAAMAADKARAESIGQWNQLKGAVPRETTPAKPDPIPQILGAETVDDAIRAATEAIKEPAREIQPSPAITPSPAPITAPGLQPEASPGSAESVGLSDAPASPATQPAGAAPEVAPRPSSGIELAQPSITETQPAPQTVAPAAQLPQSEIAPAEAPASQATSAPSSTKIADVGRTPQTAEPLTLRQTKDGQALYHGDFEVLDYESAEPVVFRNGETPAQIREYVQKNRAQLFGKAHKIYPPKTEKTASSPPVNAASSPVTAESSPVSDRPMQDFATKRGEVKVFQTEKQAGLYQKNKTNNVPGNYKPRQTEAGWVLSRPGPIEKQAAARKAAGQRLKSLDPNTDTIMQAIRKLGGLRDTNELLQDGADKPDLDRYRGILNAKGDTLDGMAAKLDQYGYPVRDEEGNYSREVLRQAILDSLAGEKIYTPEGRMQRAAKDAELRAEAEARNLPPEAAQVAQENEDAEPIQSLDIGEMLAEDDTWSEGRATDYAAFMRAMGATEEEINAEINNEEGQANPGQAAAGEAQGDVRGRDEGGGAGTPEARQGERSSRPGRGRRKADLTREELIQEALTSKVVDLPNLEAFAEDEMDGKAKVYGYSDGDNFKAVNELLGHDEADKVLQGMAEIFRQAAEQTGAKAYHRSGDEFVFRFESQEQADEFDRVSQDIAARTRITVTDKDGNEYVYENPGFSTGSGQSIAAAERASDAVKQQRLESGQRSPSGQAPRGLSRIGAEGQQGNVDSGGRQDAEVRQVKETLPAEPESKPAENKPANLRTEQTPPPGGVSVSEVAESDIPPAYFLSTKTQGRVFNEGTRSIEMQEMSAKEALESVREDLDALEALYICVGTK